MGIHAVVLIFLQKNMTLLADYDIFYFFCCDTIIDFID